MNVQISDINANACSTSTKAEAINGSIQNLSNDCDLMDASEQLEMGSFIMSDTVIFKLESSNC